ncbi:XRE family transcriptional regulator [Mycetocola tolaasinivorans]|uniref:XRE family transcriptional regulator n=1 Tax=Mycetocola tolaasinivorans TaxID=76635 RepID=A0A3L7AB17_9MICO|nr:helix-turn-helix transcriptional regulator [Mycetocola tolaasinivorans]RLP77513.1 XRE family transcriptional regulator [Mycetocola tolaasinivorans]
MEPEASPQDSLATFAADLRALRIAQGEPTFEAMSRATGVSKSVLSEGLNGKKLPTERTVSSLLTMLGQDPAPWVARRAALDPRFGGVDALAPAEARTGESGKRPITRLTLFLTAAATAVVAVVATSLVWSLALGPTSADAAAPTSSASASASANATEGAEYLPYADGVDPMRTICRNDAVIAGSATHLDGAMQVQMMYSHNCMAAWGRVTRYDGKAAGNSISMRVYPAVDVDSPRSQERTAFDLQSLYTTMVIEPDVDARICGLATVTVDGETVELGPPYCI